MKSQKSVDRHWHRCSVWVLRDGDVTSVLIGASKPEQIRENVKIVEKTEFSEEELRRIDELSKAVTK